MTDDSAGPDTAIDRGTSEIRCTRCGTAPRLKSLNKNNGTVVECDCEGPKYSQDSIPYEYDLPYLPDAWEVVEDDEMIEDTDKSDTTDNVFETSPLTDVEDAKGR